LKLKHKLHQTIAVHFNVLTRDWNEVQYSTLSQHATFSLQQSGSQSTFCRPWSKFFFLSKSIIACGRKLIMKALLQWSVVFPPVQWTVLPWCNVHDPRLIGT